MTHSETELLICLKNSFYIFSTAQSVLFKESYNKLGHKIQLKSSFFCSSNPASSSLCPDPPPQKSEGYNNASNYVLCDFYCLAIYYKCFCGWYKVFEQVFKLVRNLLNIGDCYYRLCFMIYG